MDKITIDKKIISVSLVEDKEPVTTQYTELNSNTFITQISKRNKIVKGYTLKIKYKDNSFYVTLNFNYQNKLVEIFVNASSTSPEVNTYVQALSRLISNQLKYGIPIQNIIKHLDGMDSGEVNIVRFPGQTKSKFIKSIPDLLAKILLLYGDMEKLNEVYNALVEVDVMDNLKVSPVDSKPVTKKEKQQNKILKCPECKEETMRLIDGCYTCMSCGYSKCE